MLTTPIAFGTDWEAFRSIKKVYVIIIGHPSFDRPLQQLEHPNRMVSAYDVGRRTAH
jgi:hypothetical protein